MMLKKNLEIATDRAIENNDRGLLFDDSKVLKAIVDKTTGFLTAPVKLARTGVQYYMGFELGLVKRAMDKIGVLRSADEVFHPDSINSFVNLVVTDDHPTKPVTIDNVKKLQKGQVSEVAQKDSVLTGAITITDKDQIKKIKDGKVEVSVGYSNDLKESKGVFEGEKYEFAQTNIRANHLAIVDAGRCGPSCRLTVDHNQKEKNMIKITIDGIQFETEDAQLVQAIEKLKASHDAEVEGFKKKEEEDEKEKEKLKKEKDKAEAKKDAMKKDQMSDEDINKLVSDRAELLAQAKRILGDKMPECTDCSKELKTAVIDHVLPDMELDGKSIDYIDAAYDMAIKRATSTKTSLDSLQADLLKDKDGKEITRDSARGKYMTDQLGLEG